MKRYKKILTVLLPMFMLSQNGIAQDFKFVSDGQSTDKGYFRNEGVDVISFYDYYPEGHQGGVCIIMNGKRVATNGDIRFEATPGQWQPVPKLLKRETSPTTLTATLAYPDSSRHLTGFNPMIYPDVQLKYTVRTEAVDDHIEVTVDLDSPIPQEFIGKAGFNLELYPADLFGKPWIMDDKSGIYPNQPNSPLEITSPNHLHTGDFHKEGAPLADIKHFIPNDNSYSPIVADDIVAEPYAVGKVFVSRPDNPYSKLTVESLTGDLKLYDGRMNHNNGWFVLRSEIKPGVTKGAVKWILRPNIVEGWLYQPVIQISQVGYAPTQSKVAVIECDSRDNANGEVELIRMEADKDKLVKTIKPVEWGNFLRYKYLHADFSDVTSPGIYQLRYKNSRSTIFRIDEDVYDRGVWQPVIEYFLPNQMCHMRVNEKYKVWHGLCHMDDATMAQPTNSFDGYVQKPGLSPYEPGQQVCGVAVGGWHDAGDFDLRIESQSKESYILSLIYEQFQPEIDVTSIDQQRHITEIHQPDGKNDILQQIEHGMLSVVAGYKALGRPYRGIICNQLRQYVLLGDASVMTDGVTGNDDDRWIYTEDNPNRDLHTAATLAGTYRTLKLYNDTLANQCLDIAKSLFEIVCDKGIEGKMELPSIYPAVELYLSTYDGVYRDYIIKNKEFVLKNIPNVGWYTARVAKQWEQKGNKQEKAFAKDFRKALSAYKENIQEAIGKTPYGVPYNPDIWGAGWSIQQFGVEYYMLTSAYPDVFDMQPMFSALNFVLGCHPGSNRASFASGIGTESATVAYGTNRGEWTYVPGGVISGTAIIRPDFPELLNFPYLWQQAEYVMGGGATNYMFLVLAALKENNQHR